MKTIKDDPTLMAIIAIILAVAALWAIGCGGGGGGAYSTPTTPSATTPTSTASTAPPATGASVTVAIVGSAGSTAFTPNPAPAASGQSVGFKNNDGTPHHIVADNGSWDSGDIAPGATSKTLSVTSTNTLTFHCTIHPTMVASINGTSAPPPPTENPSGGYSYDYIH